MHTLERWEVGDGIYGARQYVPCRCGGAAVAEANFYATSRESITSRVTRIEGGLRVEILDGSVVMAITEHRCLR